MDILSVVTRVPLLVFGVERHDDDFADRINYKYTVAVLVIFAIIVTNRQFGTKQIHCWIPAYFTRNYEEYINDICWVSNTYYISLDQKLPDNDQTRKSFELKYYQWVPFILLSQAFFFYIPHIAWRALSRRSGIDVRDIVEAAGNYKSVDKYENRQKYMSYMLTAVDQYVDDPRRRKETRTSLLIKRLLSVVCCVSGKFLGNYLMVLYLFIKLAFIANCISQMFVLNLLLGHEFHKFGFELLEKIINGKGWDTGSRIFPKISMCDFRIREVGNPKVSHRYTVQCVLPINLFNQQIFIFIWFWYFLVLIINIYSLCVWSYRFLPSKRLRYIKRRIEIMRQALFWRHKNPLNFEQMPDESLEMHEFEKEIIEHFVHEYLESDGLFILRVLSSNTSDFVCTELIQELWKYYRKQRKFNRESEDDEDDDEDDDLNEDDDDEEKISIKHRKPLAKTLPPAKVNANNRKRNMLSEKSKTDSNQNSNLDEADDQEENDEENENDETGMYGNQTSNKLQKNLYPSDLMQPKSSKAFGQRNQRIASDTSSPANSTSMMKQKLKNNRNLSRPLATLGGQIAQIYKSKSKNQFVSTTSSNQEHDLHIKDSTNSSKVQKFSLTISNEPTPLTSANAYLISPQPIPHYSSGSLKLSKNRINRTQTTTELSEKHEDNQFTETEMSPSELQSPSGYESNQDNVNISTTNNNNNNNRSNLRHNSASFVRLNSAGDQTKSRYLETET